MGLAVQVAYIENLLVPTDMIQWFSVNEGSRNNITRGLAGKKLNARL